MSALLHDIGHFPLSHTLETALKKFYEKFELKKDENIEKEIVTTSVKDNINHLKNRDKIKTFQSDTKLHEEMAEYVIFFTSIGEELKKLGLDIARIVGGIKGETSGIGDVEPKDQISTLTRNLIHSQLDADRIDYLLRDAVFSGVCSGIFDLDKLLEEIRYNEEGKYGVNIPGIRVVEQFFLSRYAAYSQVVFNRKVHAWEFMASDFYYRLLEMKINGELPKTIEIYSFEELKNLLKTEPVKFLNFTDHFFFKIVENVLDCNLPDYTVNMYAKLINERKPLKIVYVVEELCNNKEEFEEKFNNSIVSYFRNEENKRKLAEKAGVKPEDILIDEKPLKVTIFERGKDPIAVFNKNKVVYNNISDCEFSILKLFAEKVLYIDRIFTFDEDKQRKIQGCLKNVLPPQLQKEFKDYLISS
ncbi:HD domain-containing protein [Caldicellulosiruptor naganoensis]|uniref:HD domain-containing protein n=1 Tax=Caldicellulosiruptor naganoensis TaxID=29324 RepID=A0ABY7BDX0_9FIRM|nr:hypothetical protein [Caldicellulosiruptor naganoensis]WAM31024.1 hypothetical protein OTJ99_001828 [Caldicellulosiruptor naganoensis]